MIWHPINQEILEYIMDPESALKDFDYIYSNQPAKREKAIENNFKVKYKTEKCKNWANGICEYGDRCAFAHGEGELRDKGQIAKNFKSKSCKQFFEQGYCFYGNKCQFNHKATDADVENNVVLKKNSDTGINKRLSVFVELENRGL